MGQLVDEDVVQMAGAEGGVIEVNGRADQPEQAGGGKAACHVHRQWAGDGQFPLVGAAGAPEAQGEAEVDEQEPRGGQPHAGVPDDAKDGKAVMGDGDVQPGVGIGSGGAASFLRGGRPAAVQMNIGDVPAPVPGLLKGGGELGFAAGGCSGGVGRLAFGGVARSLHRFRDAGALRKAGDGHRRGEQRGGDKHPQGGQQPQRVGQPGVRPAPEQAAQEHDGGDEDAGGQDPRGHFDPSCSSACRSRA